MMGIIKPQGTGASPAPARTRNWSPGAALSRQRADGGRRKGV